MPYNKVTRPGTQAETYGDYHKKSYQSYRPGNHQKLYGANSTHQLDVEGHSEPVATPIKKLSGKIDYFAKRSSDSRPIKTTASTYRG